MNHTSVTLGKKSMRSKRPGAPLFNSPEKMYDDKIPLKKQKYKDLQKLLKFILPVHHEFYKCLPQDEADVSDEELHPDIEEDAC